MLVDHDKKELHFFICPDKMASSQASGALEGTTDTAVNRKAS
jgi:hypothetical protein